MGKVCFPIAYPSDRAERKKWAKRYGLNAIYAGKHWAERKKDSDYWHWLVLSALNAQRIKKRPFQRPVRITFSWHDGMDVDNHAYMAKMIVDALKGRLLVDDSKRYFTEAVHRFQKEDCISVEMEEVESEQGGIPV